MRSEHLSQWRHSEKLSDVLKTWDLENKSDCSIEHRLQTAEMDAWQIGVDAITVV